MTNCYDAWTGEDGNMDYYNGNMGNAIYISTQAGTFRPAYARCSLQFSNLAFGQRLWAGGPQATAWVSHRATTDNGGTVGYGNDINPNSRSNILFGLLDQDAVLRVAVSPSSSQGAGQAPLQVWTLNAAGAWTHLGQTFSQLSPYESSPDKLDMFYDSGHFKLFINKALVFSYTGSIFTDGITGLAGSILASGGGPNMFWSESFVSPIETSDMYLSSSVITGAGTLDEWTGAASDVDGMAVNDTVYNTVALVDKVQRYAVTNPQIGNNNVLSVIKHLRATTGGGTDITNIEFVDLIDGVQYTSADAPLPSAFHDVTLIQDVSPATGQPWGDMPTEVGFKSKA